MLAAGVVIGIVVATPKDDDPPAAGTADTGGKAQQGWTPPRFVVTADSWGADPESTAWFQILDIADGSEERVVDAVAPPSPTAGEVTSIVAGPGNTFVVAAWQVQSCQTTLYRFTLTDDGHAQGLEPLTPNGD